ncbi:hypothetical protein ACFP7A_08900 [Sporolactobacillus kofuensis]|uniref:FeoB-associated Cys-rich membrane protein n=1 Tax=Sporolactobacillus kofuensis TaxID=269672 RepID=A0ABW1WI06_9BACL|nr:hypothetical protein [Sporolactobacillus kofuensis]MCO7176696.1 hypothetical protein [Sporolactobacillus kofuensis]
MNGSTILILFFILTLYVLAIRYVKRNKSACTDCGLSGACPVKDLRKTAKQCHVSLTELPKPSRDELRMMIRND